MLRSPPWPVPDDPVIGRLLVQELADEGWVTPDWESGGLRFDPGVEAGYRAGGRDQLARKLFDAKEVEGEWWMDSITGTLLSSAMASAFDWDRSTKADHVLESDADPDEVLEGAEPEIRELIGKLNDPSVGWSDRDRAYLGSPLIVDEKLDLLFTMWGPPERRLLPDELSDLEPRLKESTPELFGRAKVGASRVLRLPRRPVEAVARAVEAFPLEATELPPASVVERQVAALRALVARRGADLVDWLVEGLAVRPVTGPADVHFAAFEEMCAAAHSEDTVLLASAFLNPEHAADPSGLASALRAAPAGVRFVLVYGHADDSPLTRQHADIEEYLTALGRADSAAAARLTVVPGLRRSHEKVAVTSSGHWMLGSWNAASSRPGGLLFECGLAGRDVSLAAALVRLVRTNVEQDAVGAQLEGMAHRLDQLGSSPSTGAEEATVAVERLDAACALLLASVPRPDGSCGEAWPHSVRAVRAALHPFRTVAHVQVVDEQQTREVYLQHVGAARKDVLLASDRLGESGLDPATLGDLQGRSRLVRILWGREWGGERRPGRSMSRQLQRARRTVRDARKILGRGLLTSDQPMENHAKGVIVDGLHGLITSENLLSYGGEKGQRESRELGLSFASPVLARDLFGRMVLQRIGVLERPDSSAGGPPYPWFAAVNETWHALAPLAEELDFAWSEPEFLGAAVQDQAAELAEGDEGERLDALARLREARGDDPFPLLAKEARRLGLAVEDDKSWLPWDSGVPVDLDALLSSAREAVDALPPPPADPAGSQGGTAARRGGNTDPIVRRVEATLVRIPAGRFRMGDDRAPGEGPSHDVVISWPFLLARTGVTQALWRDVMGDLPRLRDIEAGPDMPIVNISMREMRQFLARLNSLSGSGDFDLPTEAQWEYACRAGSTAAYCFGEDPGHARRPGLLEEYAWTKRNSGHRSHEVGVLRPNAWGLCDMHGLVYETVRDGRREFTRDEVTDPVGPDRPPWVARGGSWGRFPTGRRQRVDEHFRSASRQVHERSHRVGFRLMRRVED
ncbi:MAG: SUMF1/EgtB/PvdO family nonheme iron enzyme [Proteobacteria bacterium]|nr:SUMF1/EgtB/PvdO family nonheme iron enzyme [Pseudomonadota bacterium]